MGRLNFVGSSKPLKRRLFPLGFAGEVMNLVNDTWQTFSQRAVPSTEEPLTAIFRDALIKAYIATGRRWFVTLEDPITDEAFGTELGRNDLRFYPPEHYGQTVYFAVECKRLHVKTQSGFKHRAAEYVSQGLQRFVDGKYGEGLPCGGMLGYVMDNRIDDAFERVKGQIKARKRKLRMPKRNAIRLPSSVLSLCAHSADTFHRCKDGKKIIHHLLVKTSTRILPA